jgi:hypothetical protein
MRVSHDHGRLSAARLNRREVLTVGALGVGGLTLADVRRSLARDEDRARARAVIMICFAGGPSHIDMYDLKPDAPANVRGEFKPIKTVIPGFDICELFPLQAKIADRLALVRTVQFLEPMQHELHECYSGYPKQAKRPAFGSLVGRFRAGHDSKVPRYVSLDNEPKYASSRADIESPQYAGPAYQPFFLGDRGVDNLSTSYSLTPEVLGDRKRLLASFDTLRRDVDFGNRFDALDAFQAQALELITSTRVRDAFDLSREPDKVHARYCTREGKFMYGNQRKLDNLWQGAKFLLARRLVEAGVSVVSMRVGRWDHHGTGCDTGNIFEGLRSELPLLDLSLSALVSDLHDRGLDKDVVVLAWGEFGRTPKVNQAEGRDHWPDVGFALFAGGGLKTGQVVGATDALAAYPKSRPYRAEHVLGTLYHALGIEPDRTLPDFTGRPRTLLEDGRPIAELI